MAEPGGQEIESSPKIPEFRLPPSGTQVRVERGSGEVQLGWEVAGENPVDKRIIVTYTLPEQQEVPQEQRRILRKDLTREEFIRVNPVPGIDDVNSFEDLKSALERVSFVKGSEQNYTSKELLDTIARVREGKLDINAVTRTGGLRGKVQQLLGPLKSS